MSLKGYKYKTTKWQYQNQHINQKSCSKNCNKRVQGEHWTAENNITAIEKYMYDYHYDYQQSLEWLGKTRLNHLEW